jgi:hypothetical protein
MNNNFSSYYVVSWFDHWTAIDLSYLLCNKLICACASQSSETTLYLSQVSPLLPWIVKTIMSRLNSCVQVRATKLYMLTGLLPSTDGRHFLSKSEIHFHFLIGRQKAKRVFGIDMKQYENDDNNLISFATLYYLRLCTVCHTLCKMW